MDEDLVDFLLFLEFSLALADSNVLLLPVLGADGISSGLDHHTLERLHSSTHLLVQLLLHRVDMESDVLAHLNAESERLFDALPLNVQL